MKTLTFLGSPRGKKSSSYHVAQHFITGLKNAGCHTEEILVRDLSINPCRGCFTCWTKTPGRCIHRDDMGGILEKIVSAQLIVYAFPLYYYNMPGIVKNLLDRQIPLVKPELIERNGVTGHPPRNPEWRNKVFLISVAGFPERSHFDALVSAFEKSFKSEHNKFIGNILIGGAEPLHIEEMQATYSAFYKLVEQAGFEVGKNGTMSDKTNKEIIARTAYTKKAVEEFRKMGNQYWKSFEPVSRKPIKINNNTKELKLNSGGIKSFLAGMAMQYKPAGVPDFEGSVQFKLDDSPYFLAIKDNVCKAYKGQIDNPTTVITTTENTWIDIATGKLNGQQAVMDGKMKIDGELGLVMKMGELFGGNNNHDQDENTSPVESGDKSPQDHIQQHRGPIKIPGMLWLNVMFIPWIIKWIWGGLSTSAVPLLTSAGLALVIFIYHIVSNRPTLFEIGTVVYLTLAAVFKIFNIQLYVSAIFFFDNLFLSALWLGSLMTAFTLTGEYSRYNLPKPLWHSHAFIKTNQIICGVWGLYFMLCALLGFLSFNGVGHELFWRVLSYVMLVPLFIFTSVFQNWYPKKIMTQNVSA
ncbi:MAG: NAD(P)H-dependent oxidoreductase [Spirochaetales bacterium]|nr:NAD(P)H-dependent oxidoreductase [Spirochaetales bacterium]